MKMMPLTLDNAIKLYQVLAPHIPNEIDEDPLDFVGKIVKHIKESGKHSDYADALEIMTGYSFNVLAETYTSEEALQLFISGLMENRILTLKSFCDEMKL